MKRTGIAVLLACAVASGWIETGEGQGRGNGRMRRVNQPIPNQYIVVLNAGEDPGQVGRDTAAALGGRTIHTYRRALRGFSARLTPEAAARLAEDRRVRFVEEDGVLTISQSQNSAPAALDRIDQRMLPLDGIYEYTEVASFVRVHVIDTGVRATHQEFGGRASIGGDYVDDDADGDPSDLGNDDADPATADGSDCNGHGTHVAGIIGGATYGVAKNVSIRAYRILNCEGSGSVSGALAAIDAINSDSHRPALVNMSLGGEPSDALDAAVRGAIANGLTFVVAAGNSLSDASNFSPARVSEAITVGATDVNDIRGWFSNYGPSLDVFAPGVNVTSAWYTSDTAAMAVSGTSMAAPHVSGVVAMHLSRSPDLIPEQMHDRVVNAATPNVVISPGTGSPNRLIYSNLDHSSAPAVTLLAPAAGERVLAGRPYTIGWLASDPDGLASFDVLLSLDGGSSYAAVSGCSGLDAAERSCNWASPGPETTTARLRVIAHDATGDSAFDHSPGNFSIVTLPDLRTLETSFSSSPLSPDSTVVVADRVLNDGNVSSGTSTTRYYLSQDAEKGTGDTQLTGSRPVPDLAAGMESAGTVTLTVPSSALPGTYMLLACADSSRIIKELDETNNCAAAPGQFVVAYANLITPAVGSPPSSAAPGTSFAVSDTVQNSSEVTATASKVRYYFSSDGVRDGSDFLLNGTRSVPILGAGESSSGGRSVSIPSTMPTGTFRLLACADDTTIVDESNETDNCSAAASSILIALPDLVAISVSHQPAATAPGSTFTVTDSVRNVSPVTSDSATTRYYLSVDAQASPDDLQLSSSRYVASLEAGATSTGSRTVTVPETVAQGTYRVIACADATGSVDESNESNNCAASATSILVAAPDLVTTAVSNPPASASPGSTFSISDTVQNASLVETGYTTTRYYLSLDGLKSTDDVLLTAVRTVLSLAPGATSSGSRTLTVPATMPPGPYTVLACADDTLKIDEVNESNNCRASAAAVVVALPDLVMTALTNPPSTVNTGGTFSITDTVQNTGPAGTDGWSTVRYFLSLDLTFDATDLRLTASRSMNSLAPGASSTGTRTLRMPASPGTYYVIACADADADIAESDEANNCRVSATPVNVQGQ